MEERKANLSSKSRKRESGANMGESETTKQIKEMVTGTSLTLKIITDSARNFRLG